MSLSEVLMAYGFDRFLTTHTGSLPRPDDLIRAMFAKEEGVPVDRAALGERITEAVAEIVKKQVEAGVDLVNDGEMSKPSYATYVKDRLTGFGGSSNTFVYQDLAEFPAAAGEPLWVALNCQRFICVRSEMVEVSSAEWVPGRLLRLGEREDKPAIDVWRSPSG